MACASIIQSAVCHKWGIEFKTNKLVVRTQIISDSWQCVAEKGKVNFYLLAVMSLFLLLGGGGVFLNQEMHRLGKIWKK